MRNTLSLYQLNKDDNDFICFFCYYSFYVYFALLDDDDFVVYIFSISY